MPGVFRPHTFVDILESLNSGNNGQVDQIINGLGFFAETDEGTTTNDTVTGTLIVGVPAWDAGRWGASVWG